VPVLIKRWQLVGAPNHISLRRETKIKGINCPFNNKILEVHSAFNNLILGGAKYLIQVQQSQTTLVKKFICPPKLNKINPFKFGGPAMEDKVLSVGLFKKIAAENRIKNTTKSVNPLTLQ
jgi:hypothetical protein